MRIEVLTAQWTHDGGTLAGGVHDVAKPSKKLLEQVALAEHVGSVKVLASTEERAKMRSAVEPDSKSLEKLAKAQANSSWHEGNLQDYIAVKTAVLAGKDLDPATRSQLERDVAQATRILSVLGDTKDYGEAVTRVLADG